MRQSDSSKTAMTGESDPSVRLELEYPDVDAVLRPGENLTGFGWALADARIRSIAVELDDRPLCQAITGLSRADLPDDVSQHPGSGSAGFTFVARVPMEASERPLLRVIAVTDSGRSVRETRVRFVGPSPAAAPPPSPVAAAAEDGGLEPFRIALEEARVDAGGMLHVRGWALTSAPTQSVQVFLGDLSVGHADSQLSREDVGAAFPNYPNAAFSGFALKTARPAHLAGETEASVVVTDSLGRTRAAKAALTGPGVAAQGDPNAKPALEPILATLEEARVDEKGILRVRGWVVSLSAVEQVRVMLDDAILELAAHRLPRRDVELAYPDYPDAASSGFFLQHDVADRDLNNRNLRVVIVARGGIKRELTSELTVAPFVQLRPRPASSIEFHCDDIALQSDGGMFLKGWAVCPTGVSRIEVFLGDELVGEAEVGEARPDVGNHFPKIPSARNSGFRFQGQATAPCEGEYVARIVVHGREDEERVILQPVLVVEVQAAAPADLDPGIKYYLDTPAIKDGKATEPLRGFLALNGWAFSAAGVNGIEVFIDGRSHGQAYRGIRREDLANAFGRQEALRSGFAMLIPPHIMKRGEHDVRVVIRDEAGERVEIPFSVQVEPSMEGPGPWSLRQKLPLSEIDLHHAMLRGSSYTPHYTLLLRLPDMAAPTAKRLRATLESLRHHAYQSWRLLIAASEAADAEAANALLAADYPAFTANAAVLDPTLSLAEIARGAAGPDLLMLLSPGDRLGEDALLELSLEAAVKQHDSKTVPDFVYADERRTDPADGETRAFFKPDWSPDLLLSTNYIGRPWVARAELLARTGAVFGDLARHGEFDLVLRLTEKATLIAHAPKVLAARGAKTLDTPAEERRALTRALLRRGIEGRVKPGCLPGTFRVQRAVRTQGLVSIIIPTMASRGLIRIAIDSIREKTAYRNFEIICLDNIRDLPGIDAAEWKAWLRQNSDAVVVIEEKFNWSRFNNIAARQARGEFLAFLNDDIEITDGAWLDALLEHAQRDDVGAVGPQLLYPDGKVQHAGQFLAGHVGRHAFRFSPPDEPGPFGLALTQRNVIGVTGACLLTRRDVFDELGGFDEEHAVINNDLDFCLRVRESGRAVVFTPHVSLIHHEMVSRADLRDVYDAEQFQSRWRSLFLTGDPYFNPNLAADVDDYVPEQEPFRPVHVGHPVFRREDIRRILAVKVDHIGDFVSAFPAFRRLKEVFPNAELTVLAAAASQSLISLEPAIDHVMRYDFFHARSERGKRSTAKKDLARLEEELTARRFDLAVDLRRQPDTRHILQHTGARWLAGYDKENATRWLDVAVEWEGDVARSHKRTHISETLVQLVEAIRAASDTDRRVMRPPSTREAAREVLRGLPEVADMLDPMLSRRVVCLHLSAGADNKQWPIANFAGLVDLLCEHDDLNAVVIGGPNEGAMFEELRQQIKSPDRLYSAVGKVSLRNLPLMIMQSDLYIGNDSGPKHIAASLGVPTVGVHAGSVDAVEWGPMGPLAIGVRRDMSCSPCYIAKVADCPRSMGCLRGIKVADVYRACRRLLLLSANSIQICNSNQPVQSLASHAQTTLAGD